MYIHEYFGFVSYFKSYCHYITKDLNQFACSFQNIFCSINSETWMSFDKKIISEKTLTTCQGKTAVLLDAVRIDEQKE